jgi:hypothetical protein
MDSAESLAILEQTPKLPASSTILQQLLAGGIAGSAGVIVGHPFDSIKVRLQTNCSTTTTSPTTISCLFRGIGPPVATAAIVNALIFGSYNESSRIFDTMQFNNTTGIKPFACGMFTGVVSSLVIAPTEHIKCRLQVGSTNNYRGPIDAIKRIVASHGVFILYRGLGATILRQSPSFGIYFGTYDHIKRAVCHRFGISSESSPQHSNNKRRLAASALAGGIAGSLAWAVVYPMDVIKSRIQTMPLEKPSSIRHVAHTLYASGWRSLYRGVGITVLRAFPVNGIIFPVYEFSLEQLHGTFSTTTQTADDIIGTTLLSYPTVKR